MSDKIKYIILFYVGFTTYLAIEVLFRGYSYPLMGFTGAVCFLLFDKINEIIPWNMDLLWQGIIGSCIVTGFEFAIGTLLQYFALPPMWDYSAMWLNYKGIICPLFSFIWVLIACVGIVLADCINYYLLWNGDRPQYTLLYSFHISFPKRKHCC